uniref:Uncharacterized protein n=1 Tax=Timema poppense TaxID=170557 RepID=A0A7R9DNJ7_TIMPO|nr:unnamed protein product [Timema poppensis]
MNSSCDMAAPPGSLISTRSDVYGLKTGELHRELKSSDTDNINISYDICRPPLEYSEPGKSGPLELDGDRKQITPPGASVSYQPVTAASKTQSKVAKGEEVTPPSLVIKSIPESFVYIRDHQGGDPWCRDIMERIKKGEQDVKEWVSRCEDCQMAKPAHNSRVGLHSTDVAQRPWEKVFIDYVGAITRSSLALRTPFTPHIPFSCFSRSVRGGGERCGETTWQEAVATHREAVLGGREQDQA